MFALNTLLFASSSRFFQQVAKDLFPEFSSPTFLLCLPPPRTRRILELQLRDQKFPGNQDKQNSCLFSQFFFTKPALILLCFLEFRSGISRSFHASWIFPLQPLQGYLFPWDSWDLGKFLLFEDEKQNPGKMEGSPPKSPRILVDFPNFPFLFKGENSLILLPQMK